jgi:hypothetical protein
MEERGLARRFLVGDEWCSSRRMLRAKASRTRIVGRVEREEEKSVEGRKKVECVTTEGGSEQGEKRNVRVLYV